MTSKYTSYWEDRLDDLRSAVEKAANDGAVELDVAGVRVHGERSSWQGSARVRGREILSAGMAHVAALVRAVTAAGLLDRWPEHEFSFSISPSLKLRVRAHRTSETMSRSTEDSTSPAAIVVPAGSGTVSGAERGCAEIDRLLASLPAFTDPDDAPFANGLYFFYEAGEQSPHAPEGRIVRVGNHPRSQDRLRARLRDHYRTKPNAKNFSVFRRYLGGALLRRAHPNHPCLAPGPGQGHWELQGGDVCAVCKKTEATVTDYLHARLHFRCVRIEDAVERNRWEAGMIATLAACPVCRPTSGWLGRHCYQEGVKRSGLWNAEFLGAPGLTDAELFGFRQAVEASGPARAPVTAAQPSTSGDLSDTLLVIPCCSSKQGTAIPELPLITVGDLLDRSERAVLDEGRMLAWEQPSTSIDTESALRPALAYYTGQPYKTAGFRDLLIDAVRQGLHCLIVSGGYGLLRPEEPIHRYRAHMPTQTRSVWHRRLRRLLPAYVERQGIRRAYVTLSASYANCLPYDFAPEEWWAIPEFDAAVDRGSPMRVVPARVGALGHTLLQGGFSETKGWERR